MKGMPVNFHIVGISSFKRNFQCTRVMDKNRHALRTVLNVVVQ